MDSLVNEGFPLPIPQTDEDGRARQAPVVRKPARKRSLTWQQTIYGYGERRPESNLANQIAFAAAQSLPNPPII